MKLLTLIYPLVAISVLATPVYGNARGDSRTREYISPESITWMGNPELISNADYLMRTGNGQADLTNSHICIMRSTKSERPAILLDFGKELHGGLQIVTGMPATDR